MLAYAAIAPTLFCLLTVKRNSCASKLHRGGAGQFLPGAIGIYGSISACHDRLKTTHRCRWRKAEIGHKLPFGKDSSRPIADCSCATPRVSNRMLGRDCPRISPIRVSYVFSVPDCHGCTQFSKGVNCWPDRKKTPIKEAFQLVNNNCV